MKAVLHRHIGVEPTGKGKFHEIVLAEDANYLVIDSGGTDFVKVVREGPKIAAMARVRDLDYVTLEG